jgi:hypothetical protein
MSTRIIDTAYLRPRIVDPRHRSRLLWAIEREGGELCVSIDSPSRSVFDTVMATGSPAASTHAADAVLDSLAGAADRPGVIAARSFMFQMRPMLLFTLTITIGEPEADADADGPTLIEFGPPAADAPSVSGIASDGAGLSLKVLSAVYTLENGPAPLTLRFTTPCVDGANEFLTLFDSLARSCRLEQL